MPFVASLPYEPCDMIVHQVDGASPAPDVSYSSGRP